MRRREFMHSCFVGAAALSVTSHFSASVLAATTPTSEADGKKWFNMENLPLEGRAWEGEERLSPYDRFPKRWMEKVTPAVRGNATHSAGMTVRFRTNANDLFIRYETTSTNLAMYHMPATGMSGFDLYGRDEKGMLRFIDLKQCGAKAETQIGKGLTGNVSREYVIYLPLYNGLKSFELGVPSDGEFELVTLPKKPVLYYGTSIVHGGCASRPGMTHPAILARRLDMPHWNFGFSGSGKMEMEIADAFGELDSSAYVLDCLPNMTPEMVKERLYNFVIRLREKRPDTPILLVEDRRSPSSWVIASKNDFHNRQHAAHRAEYERLLAANVKGLSYVEGDTLQPPDGDGTVDDSHSTDYGFWYQANAMEGILRKALNL